MSGAVKKVKVVDLDVSLFVRRSLDQDHVLYLAELIENGIAMTTRIRVTPSLSVIDGRHRIEAYILNNVEEVEVEVVRVKDELALLAEAYKANTGGSLPPSREDTEHTIGLMLDRKATMTSIAKMLGLPPSLTRNYIRQVKTRRERKNLMDAAKSVRDCGNTVPKAAEQYGVDPDKLREQLNGKQKKVKAGVPEIKRATTTIFKSSGLKTAHQIRKALEHYEDGDLSAKQVNMVFAHLENLQRKSSRALADWKKRFQAMDPSQR